MLAPPTTCPCCHPSAPCHPPLPRPQVIKRLREVKANGAAFARAAKAQVQEEAAWNTWKTTPGEGDSGEGGLGGRGIRGRGKGNPEGERGEGNQGEGNQGEG